MFLSSAAAVVSGWTVRCLVIRTPVVSFFFKNIFQFDVLAMPKACAMAIYIFNYLISKNKVRKQNWSCCSLLRVVHESYTLLWDIISARRAFNSYSLQTPILWSTNIRTVTETRDHKTLLLSCLFFSPMFLLLFYCQSVLDFLMYPWVIYSASSQLLAPLVITKRTKGAPIN